MTSAWIQTFDQDEAFNELLHLYSALEHGKTADPARLRLRINRIWGALTINKKKEWTDRLVQSGALADQVAQTVKTFQGTIIQLV